MVRGAATRNRCASIAAPPEKTVPHRICPHCDSRRTEQMKDRAYEQQSATTWYQCLDCGRMWSVPKPPTERPPADDDSSTAS